jgi:hypothetical protein
MSENATKSVKMTTADSLAAPEDEQLAEAISKLVELWTPHHREGLTVRHETGRMLNQLISPPSVRQDYGANVLERVSEQIGVSRSELSRMRKFAEAIPDLEAFRRDHSECTTWTKVKAHLATIDAKGQPVSKKKRVTSPSKGVCRSINALKKKVKGVKSNLTTDDRQRVIIALVDLAQAMRGALGITVQVTTDQDSVSKTNTMQKGKSQAA